MTSLNMWCLLPIALLLLFTITPTVTEVVTSMSDCKEFLLDEKTPQIRGILQDGHIQKNNQYKVICQTYENVRRFVTLYDTKNRIPVFSAYKYRGEEAGGQRPSWMIEPQLEDDKKDKNMKKDTGKHQYQHQASNNDYKNADPYNRGHLKPCSYGFDAKDKESTCTLTNIVPQIKSFNGGSWAHMESCVKCIMHKYCINSNDKIEGYVVTGAKTGPNKLKERVNIPSVLWSAFCCYSKVEKKWLASAYWGGNVECEGKYLPTNSLKELLDKLAIEAFPKTKCPPSETIDTFYPSVDKDCNCPENVLTKSTNTHFISRLWQVCRTIGNLIGGALRGLRNRLG